MPNFPYSCQKTAACRTTSRRILARPGLTLVEMLVAVTITLMIMAAIVQLFGFLGKNLRNTRAVMSVTADLRLIASQIQADTDGITCPVRPGIDLESGLGYFEYIEGISRDYDWNANGIVDSFDLDGNGVPDEATSYGDIDDVLAFTTRNTKTPFVGQAPAFQTNYTDINGNGLPDMGDEFADSNGNIVSPSIEAAEAEVIWWTAVQDISMGDGTIASDGIDSDNDGVPDVGNTVMLFRRAMLIRPDLPPIRGLGSLELAYAIMARNNVSIRIVVNDDGTYDLEPNSLSDLTQRENRFMRQTNASMGSADLLNFFPHHLMNRAVWSSYIRFGRTDLADASANISPGSLGKLGTIGPAYSKLMADAVQADALLAFDVRAYDPRVAVKERPAGGLNVAVTPADPGYIDNPDRFAAIPSADDVFWSVGGVNVPLARGAYVDLNYADGYSRAGIGTDGQRSRMSVFSGPPHPTSRLLVDRINGAILQLADYSARPAVYDTWSTIYERDGADQDEDGVIDEGTNGIDDDGGNGVDDIGEKEAQPPYNRPLRGIEVRLRMMDYETRQVRQVSVVADFVPE